MNMKNKKWENDFSPIDPEGDSFVDQQYSRAYLRHLFSVKEMLAGMIASQHNLAFYLWLVREARKHILEGDFANLEKRNGGKVSQRLYNSNELIKHCSL